MAEFLRPRLVGARFEGGNIPLEVLSDLSALREIVIEVAKWRYLLDHPNRQRSPKGFARGVSLNLTGVGEGSAILAISIEFHSSQLPNSPQLPGMPGQYEQYFLEARDAVIDAIAAAECDEPPTKALPENILSHFDRLGSRLQDGESIEFHGATHARSARLTKESRRRLVLASRLNEVTQEVSVRGYIPEVNQDRMTFQFQLLEGRKVDGVIHSHHFDTVLEVFGNYKSSGRAIVRGLGKYDRQERLVRLESIEDILSLDPLDVPARLYELRGLKNGWLDGEGVAPSTDRLNWLAETFDRLYPDELPLPHVYPTVEGGIQAEWSLGSCEASLTIDLAARKGDWHVLPTGRNAEDVEVLSLADDAGWMWLAQRIRSLSEAPK